MNQFCNVVQNCHVLFSCPTFSFTYLFFKQFQSGKTYGIIELSLWALRVLFNVSIAVPLYKYNIPGRAKGIVFAIKMNLLLPCFGLSALYLPTPEPALRPGITLPPYTQHVLIWS